MVGRTSSSGPRVSFSMCNLAARSLVHLIGDRSGVLHTVCLRGTDRSLGSASGSGDVVLRFPRFNTTYVTLKYGRPSTTPRMRGLPLLARIRLLTAIFSLAFPSNLGGDLVGLKPAVMRLLGGWGASEREKGTGEILEVIAD